MEKQKENHFTLYELEKIVRRLEEANEQDQLQFKIEKIAKHQAKEVYHEEEQRKESMQCMKEERLKTNIREIAEKYARSFFNDRETQLHLETKQIAVQTSENLCLVKIPEILDKEAPTYLRSIIKKDNRLNTAYEVCLGNLRDAHESAMQKIQVSIEGCLIDFNARILDSTQKIINEILERKRDEEFFVHFLQKLKIENESQVRENTMQLHNTLVQTQQDYLNIQTGLLSITKKVSEENKKFEVLNETLAKDIQNTKLDLFYLKCISLGLLSLSILFNVYQKVR